MSSTPISGLTPAVLLQGVSTNTSPGGATSVPPGILALPSGTLLRGRITSVDTLGNAILYTAKGEITLKTSLPLHKGNDVVLRLDTTSSGLSARIISVDGLTPKELQQQSPAIPSHPVDDIVETLGQKTPQEALKSALTETEAAPLRSTIPFEKTLLPQEIPLRAVLLSRAPELNALLRELPPTVTVLPGRIDSGAHLLIRLLPQSIVLPSTTSAAILPENLAHSLLGTPSPTAPVLSSATPPGNAASVAATPLAAFVPPPSIATPGATASALSAATSSAAAPQSPAQPAVPGSITATQSPLSSGAPVAALGGTLPTSPLPAATSLAVPPASSNLPGATVTLEIPPVVSSTPSPLPALSLPGASQPVPAASPGAPFIASPPLPLPPGTAEHTPPLPANPTASTFPTTPVASAPVLPAAILPSASATPSLAPAAAIQQGLLSAQVIGTEQSGETVLKTALGTLKLDLPLVAGERPVLPPGTQMSLQLVIVEPAASPVETPITGSRIPGSLSELTSHWNSLRDALQLIQQVNPALAQQIMDTIIPQPGPKMAATMLFFVSALRGGEVKDWLGRQAVNALEQLQRHDLVNRLGGEFSTLRQFFMDSPSPNWQAAFIPVYHNNEWQQARLFLRKDPQEQENKNERVGTRFIVEVDLSNFGPMQFDGFIRKKKPNTQFDLIIRSHVALPENDRQEIRNIFTSAAEITGFIGGISFQVGRPFPISPMEEMAAPDGNMLA